jgi:hypothetical protein
MIQKIDKFPRSQRFVLGDRLENLLLDILDLLIEANYSQDKVPILRAVNLKLEKGRYLIRIAKELRLININGYEFSARSVNEIGRMVGGWIKARENK